MFIDPPYNTGSAFEHYDDGIEHSIWLSLMRDRLEILRRLISEDGSLWITIDDNEAHYLKFLCDEVFGRRNFVANVIWQKKFSPQNDAKWISNSHDHILCYAKVKESWRPNALHRSDAMDNRYKNPDNDPKGVWASTDLTRAEHRDRFRRHTLLPLDDCLYALQATIPHLTRSSLHRCLQRHNISRFPDVEGGKTEKKKFKSYPIGYFHIDIAEVQTAEGKLYLFVAIDRTSKFTHTELHQKAGKMTAAQFLRNLTASVPYTIHTLLTDNGVQFTNRATDIYAGIHIFDRVCKENDIEHRQTKVKHPWTNGQVERMNRTIKEATVKRFHYENHDELSSHLTSFVAAYNFAKRLKTLKGLTPYEFICKTWTNQPELFKLNPLHEMPGLNN